MRLWGRSTCITGATPVHHVKGIAMRQNLSQPHQQTTVVGFQRNSFYARKQIVNTRNCKFQIYFYNILQEDKSCGELHEWSRKTTATPTITLNTKLHITINILWLDTCTMPISAKNSLLTSPIFKSFTKANLKSFF